MYNIASPLMHIRGRDRNPPFPASGKAASRSSMAAIVLWRLRLPGAAGFREPDGGVAAHARSHGGGGARTGCRKRCDPLQRLREFVVAAPDIGAILIASIPRSRKTRPRTSRLDERDARIRCRKDGSNHVPL
jgi:hypothetical protein